MNYILAQLVLAARKSDEDTGWMQILVVVILAIFYAVGSIVKARANKAAPKGKKQIPRKRPESAIDLRMLKQLFGLPEEAESGSQPSPEASKPLVRAKRPAVARQVVRPSAFSETSPLGGQVQPKLEELPELTPDVLLRKSEAAGAEIPQTKYLSEILSDYETAESLRRAILHYEILGKPISLREPGEHIIGL
jgi:hypothetical protein